MRAFKRLVRALHGAGIEVILDLVFNHTAEGGLDGPTTSFRGLDNATYYLIDPTTGKYLDYSGCGNSLNCNHPVVRDFILDCHHRPVDGGHLAGKTPTGNGTAGGNFESWFIVRDDRRGQRRRDRSQHNQGEQES